MSRDCFSYWDGRLGPDADSNITPRSRAEATPDWYTQMVDELETERQAHLYTKEILTDLIAELRDVFGTDAEAYGERIGTFPIGSHGDEVRQYIDRAEVRLREVSDE